MSERRSRWRAATRRIREGLRHAFAVEKQADFAPTDEERAVVDLLARKVVAHGMTVPAIMFLESVRPMNFIGNQAMAFFEPVVRGLFDWRGYTVFRGLLEHRGSVPLIMDRIEHFESLAEGDKKTGKPNPETEKP